MDFKKTQVIINKYTQNGDIVIKIEKEVNDHANNSVYLGQQVSTNSSMEEEIKRTLRLG